MEISLSLLEKRLLRALPEDGSPATAQDVAEQLGFAGAGQALRAASGPQRHGLVSVQEETTTRYSLSQEGTRHQALGLPERRAIHAIHFAGGRLPMADLAAKGELEPAEVKVAIGWLKRKGWADIEQGVLVARGPQGRPGRTPAGPPDRAADREK